MRELAVKGSTEVNSGEALVQLVRVGVGVGRIGGALAIADGLTAGRLTPLLERFSPQDREPLHLLFVSGQSMPARSRVLVDFLAEELSAG